MRMSRVLISKRVALDSITMQRRPSNCCHHHKNMLLKITKRSIHHQQQGLFVQGWAINRLQQQQNTKQLHLSSSTALHHSKQCVPLIAGSRTKRVAACLNTRSTQHHTFHTATSPNGTGSHVLLSTRWGKFRSQDDARRQVARLSAEERGHLEKAIEDLKKRSEETQTEPPTWNQLKLCKAVPP